jgi:hypothetical protein
MNASRRLAVYTGGRFPPCPVEMLSQYHDGSAARTAEAAEIIERFIRRARQDRDARATSGKVVILISATNTGSLVTALQGLLAERGMPPDSVHFVALFKVGVEATNIDALRDLSVGPDAKDFAALPDGGADSETIEIDEQVYFPLQYRDFLYVIRRPQTADHKLFFDRYRHLDLVRVHHTDQSHNPPRHHAIWINTVELAGDAAFQKRLAERIRNLDPAPELIITPMHHAAQLLGAFALEIVREKRPKVRLFAHSNLFFSTPYRPGDQDVAEAIASLNEEAGLLILDDSFITGTRLAGYQTQLRNREYKGRLHYVVAVARPRSLREWDIHSRMLCQSPRWRTERFPHTVSAIETIVLPDWHSAECPWCAEIELYRRREAALGTLPVGALRDRLTTLTFARDEGLSENLFLNGPSQPLIEINRTSEFVDAPASQATVFAAVSAAIQRLRSVPENDRPVLGPRHFPVSTILNDEEYLVNVYTDTVLRASILRGATIDELVYANTQLEEQKTQRVELLLQSDDPTKTNLAAEIILAGKAGKLPKFELRKWTTTLESFGLRPLFDD